MNPKISDIIDKKIDIAFSLAPSHDISPTEIAQLAGVSRQTIQAIIVKALNKIRKNEGVAQSSKMWGDNEN
jgi:DNA-directed RNA polymerase specialized sigma24 family protein